MTVQITPTWEMEQLSRLSRIRPDLVIPALQKLLADDDELRWAVIVGAYLDRQINLGRAAERLGVHELELRERFLQLGIPLRIGPRDEAEAQAEVDVMRSWFSAATTEPAQ